MKTDDKERILTEKLSVPQSNKCSEEWDKKTLAVCFDVYIVC